MQKKLLYSYIALIMMTMIFAVGLSWKSVNNYFYQRVDQETEIESLLIKRLIEESNISDGGFQDFVNELSYMAGVRITLIANDGVVFIDSDNDADEMDNHGNRPEVKETMETGSSASTIRYSNTMKIYYFYYATPVTSDNFNGILRVSVPVDEIRTFTMDMIWIILLGVGVGSLAALAGAYFVTNRLMQPINELTRVAKVIADGNYDEKIYISQKDQIGELAEAFNSMTHTLRRNIWELTKKNAELESILTSMNSGLAAINVENRIALYNENFVKLLGLPNQDLSGKLFYEVVRELSIFDIIEKSVTEQAFLAEETSIHFDGENHIIRLTATPIFEQERKHRSIGTLIVVTDVTQIRKLERMRRDFVSNVTHELKTPLTSIRGFVDTLKHGAIRDEAVAMRFLDIIDIESERLSTLIQDILSLSEIETVVGEKNVDDYNVRDIVEEVVDIIPRDNGDVELILDIDEGITPYRCNRNRIKQLFINLIDNSMKYTEKGYVKVTCRETFRKLIIVVEDTGIGIEHKHLSRIFERFYRVDKGRSRKMGGTGLGLSIVKHIVELYSGEIKIESEVDQGTKITIELPY